MDYNIIISAKAAEQIKNKLTVRQTPQAYIRLGVKGGGCSGFSYVIAYEDRDPSTKDLIFEVDGARIIVDKKSILYLNGMTLDWEQTMMSSGFKFVNPNEKSKCSCGHSFQTK